MHYGILQTVLIEMFAVHYSMLQTVRTRVYTGLVVSRAVPAITLAVTPFFVTTGISSDFSSCIVCVCACTACECQQCQ
jgi:hypothetical protein